MPSQLFESVGHALESYRCRYLYGKMDRSQGKTYKQNYYVPPRLTEP